MSKWVRVWLHKWTNDKGRVIQRMWTLAGEKKDFFLCFMSEDDYQKGNNFASFSHLKEAKNKFEE